MSKEGRIQKKKFIREKRQEVKEQNAVFQTKVNRLLDRKYRYSLRYEDQMVADDGKAYINVDLTKVESPFSIYSYDRRVDSEIYAYIDSATEFLRAAIPVVINFDDGGKYTNEMKEKIARAVIRHYSLEFEDRIIEHRRRTWFGILAFSIGLLILLTYVLLSATILKEDNIWIEIICILSWVFIWQSVDIFFFSGHERRVDIYNSAQLASAEIKFGSPEHIRK